MSVRRPEVTHVYQNHTLDTTRWERYTPRDDDIVIATPIKSGTTWMQMIVMHLIFQDLQIRPVWELSHWLDARFAPLDEVIQKLEQQQHRRFIKTHLPLDGLPYFSQTKYIVVGRDARDVFMSLWNHHSNFTKELFTFINKIPGRVGHPFPRCPEDIRDFWHQWITVGWFDWESEGYPYWSNLRHVQTWWDFKHLPNILLVHFNDLLSNLEGEIQRIAHFLDISLSGGILSGIADAVTFENAKQKAEELIPSADQTWKGGAKTFINQGTNGRWRDVLNDDDLALYETAVARELTPDCAHWLEHGGLQFPRKQALLGMETNGQPLN
jgi:aryl sulfotransferase